MTKAQALFNFFSGFGLSAYPSNSVPDDVIYPWLTYDPIISNYGDSVTCSAHLWYHTDSEAVPNAKAEEIAEYIGLGGVTVPYDGGVMWIKRGSPWSQPLTDENDSAVKGRLLNITIEYV